MWILPTAHVCFMLWNAHRVVWIVKCYCCVLEEWCTRIQIAVLSLLRIKKNESYYKESLIYISELISTLSRIGMSTDGSHKHRQKLWWKCTTEINSGIGKRWSSQGGKKLHSRTASSCQKVCYDFGVNSFLFKKLSAKNLAVDTDTAF